MPDMYSTYQLKNKIKQITTITQQLTTCAKNPEKK